MTLGKKNQINSNKAEQNTISHGDLCFPENVELGDVMPFQLFALINISINTASRMCRAILRLINN